MYQVYRHPVAGSHADMELHMHFALRNHWGMEPIGDPVEELDMAINDLVTWCAEESVRRAVEDNEGELPDDIWFVPYAVFDTEGTCHAYMTDFDEEMLAAIDDERMAFRHGWTTWQ